MEEISVLIVDDHQVVRVGLEFMVSAAPNLRVVGQASSGIEALDKVQALLPVVVLMDLGMPEMDGLEATRRIKEQYPQTRVVVMTMHADELHVAEAVQAGVDGYLLKMASPEDIRRAIESAARGKMTINAALLQAAFRRVAETREASERQPARPRWQRSGAEALTAREISVLGLLTEGNTNREIAARLFISPGTVKRHVESILAKLGASDRTYAATMALRLGLVQ